MAVAVEEVTPESLEVGRKITSIRERKGLTQQQLAQLAGTSVSTIQRWESGRVPPIGRLLRLARRLRIEPVEFVDIDSTYENQLAEIRKELSEVKAMLRELLDR